MSKLTAPMRTTLHQAHTQGPLRRTHQPGPGQPPWPAHPNTLNALARHGYLAVTELRHRQGWRMVEWAITDTGREALAPPVRVLRDRSLFMADRSKSTSDYTSNPGRAIDLLEVVDPSVLGEAWFGGALVRHAEAADRKVRARRLANNARRAA